MQLVRPTASGSTSSVWIEWLADVTHSSGSRRTTSDVPPLSPSRVTMAMSSWPRLIWSSRLNVGSQMTDSSTRGLEREKRAMISGRKRSA